jgi:hypothetical protein
MPVYQYLDLTTAHVTEQEWEAIATNWPALDDSGPRVIKHDYGAWVNVQEEFAVGESEEAAVFAMRYPNVHRVLVHAHHAGCNWINFDQDASHEPDLPIHDW